MLPQARNHLTYIAGTVAAMHEQAAGTNILEVRSPKPESRLFPMPPLTTFREMGLPLSTLIHSAFQKYETSRANAIHIWNVCGMIVREEGVRRSRSEVRTQMSNLYPSLVFSTIPDVPDIRVELAQFLLLTSIICEGTLTTSPLYVDLALPLRRKSIGPNLAVNVRSITWSSGHYLLPTAKFNFIEAMNLGFVGVNKLSPRCAALYLQLARVLPAHLLSLNLVFKVIGMLGPEAEQVMMEPFMIVINDELPDYTPEQEADLLRLQSLLRGF